MKSAFECSHVKSVKAYAIMFKGENAGRIVANYSDNPNGSVCTCTVHFWLGPLKDKPGTTGRAGGYGYDKLSAAFEDAINRIGVPISEVHGVGETAIEKWLNGHGYKTIKVI